MCSVSAQIPSLRETFIRTPSWIGISFPITGRLCSKPSNARVNAMAHSKWLSVWHFHPLRNQLPYNIDPKVAEVIVLLVDNRFWWVRFRILLSLRFLLLLSFPPSLPGFGNFFTMIHWFVQLTERKVLLDWRNTALHAAWEATRSSHTRCCPAVCFSSNGPR